jgi:hypothetical protein
VGLGVGGLGYGPHPPIPNPQSPLPNPQFFIKIIFNEKLKNNNNLIKLNLLIK